MSYDRETWTGFVHVYCYFEPLEPVEDLTAWMDTVMSEWMDSRGYTFYSKDAEVYVYNFEIVMRDGRPVVHLLVDGDIEGEGEDDFEEEGDNLGDAIDDDFSGLEDVARIIDRGWETDCVHIDTWYDEDAAYEDYRDRCDDDY